MYVYINIIFFLKCFKTFIKKSEMEISISTFLKSKLNNFICYLEKIVTNKNDLYKQVLSLKDNETDLVKYADYISKVAKVHKSKCKSNLCEKIHKDGLYYFEEETIIDYLENNGFKRKDLLELDAGGFVTKIQRYLELFVNTVSV